MLINYLVVLLFGLLLGSVSVILIFRHVFRQSSQTIIQHELDLKELQKVLIKQEQDIHTIIYETNHYFLNPVLKRFRGLENIKQPGWQKVWEYITLIKNPNHHHKYATLLEKELKDIYNIDKNMYSVALSMEAEVLKTVEKFDQMKRN